MEVQQSMRELTEDVCDLTVMLLSTFDAPALFSACPAIP